MAIKIIPSETEGYNPKLEVKDLVAGDYIVMSIDGFLKDQEGNIRSWTNTFKSGKSTSYLAFVDVFKFYYVDIENVEKVEKTFDNPERCSFFLSEAMKRKIDESEVPEGQAFKLGMKKLDGGKSTYVVEAYELGVESPTQTSSEPQNEEKTDSVSKEPSVEEKMAKLKKAVNDLVKSEMFTKDEVIGMMVNNGYKKEEVENFL